MEEKNTTKTDGRKLRKKFFREYYPYKPTWEFKQFFLKRCKQELNEHRYNAMRNLMFKVGRWEDKHGKDVYDFTLEELKGMLKDFNSSSEMSLMSQKSNLEYYLLFAKSQKMGNLNVPSSIEINLEDVREFINQIGSEQRYITRNELYDVVTENLVNYVDQAMILLIFEGIMGKANQELIDLEWRNIDFNNGIIKSGNKLIQIDGVLSDILEKANNQEVYLLSNGETEKDIERYKEIGEKPNAKRSKVTIVDKYNSAYLLRPIESKNKDEIQITGGAIQRRILNSFKLYLDKPYLTLASLYVSGVADRGVRFSYDNYGGELMRNADWQQFIKETGEKVNLQDSYKLYKEFWEKDKEERKKLEQQNNGDQQQEN